MAYGITPATPPARSMTLSHGDVAVALSKPSRKAMKVGWSMPQRIRSGAYALMNPRSRFLGRRWGRITGYGSCAGAAGKEDLERASMDAVRSSCSCWS